MEIQKTVSNDPKANLFKDSLNKKAVIENIMREAFRFKDVKNSKLLREKVKDRLASLNPEGRKEIEMKVR